MSNTCALHGASYRPQVSFGQRGDKHNVAVNLSKICDLRVQHALTIIAVAYTATETKTSNSHIHVQKTIQAVLLQYGLACYKERLSAGAHTS
jgi:hypothetical protein